MTLLGHAFGLPAASWTDFDTGETTVAVWLRQKPEHWPAQRAELLADLVRLRSCGLAIGACRISLRKVPLQDWAESWKRHFPPLEIGSALLIRPSWSRRRPRPGQALVELDPGLSFGTGRHPTTAFCLEQIAARRRPGFAQSVLDVGAGSGILAIAAAKLGYTPVEAVELDADALRIARANARRNGLSGSIRFLRGDFAALPPRPPRRFHLICANLVANLLLSGRDRLTAWLDAEGALILAGILKTEFASIERAYAAAGLRLIASRADKEWRSGTFIRGGKQARKFP